MKRRRSARRILGCIALLLIIGILVPAVSIWTYAGRDETRRADAAIVLGAAVWETGPSPVYQERLNQAVRLYEQGYVEKLIVTGGKLDGSTMSDAAVGGSYLVEQGIPAEAVLLEEHSTITEENLNNAAEIMSREGLRTALIVSDPLHMKRAMLLAKDAGLEAYSSPTATSRYRSFGTKLGFLAREVFYYIGYRMLRLFRQR